MRNLAGVIKLAGDLAKKDESEFMERKHIAAAIKIGRPIEEQLKEKYGTVWKGGLADYGVEHSPKSGSEIA